MNFLFLITEKCRTYLKRIKLVRSNYIGKEPNVLKSSVIIEKSQNVVFGKIDAKGSVIVGNNNIIISNFILENSKLEELITHGQNIRNRIFELENRIHEHPNVIHFKNDLAQLKQEMIDNESQIQTGKNAFISLINKNFKN